MLTFILNSIYRDFSEVPCPACGSTISPADKGWVVGGGATSMSRNFGRRQTYSGYRGASWGPLVALTLIMVGLIDVAAHLLQR
jgi:hypothetical protein